jgi:hypothetical protein
MASKEQSVQVSDTTKGDSSNSVGKKYLIIKKVLPK